MPKRLPTPGLLWASLAAQLVLMLLLSTAHDTPGSHLLAARVLTGLTLTLTALGLWTAYRPPPPPPPVAAPPAETAGRSLLLAQLLHEIRTPLNTVIGMTQLMLQTPVSAEQRELLTQADGASRALIGLVADALDVARLEAGQARVEHQPLRLEDVVTQAIDQVRPLHANPAVALVCDWADASLLGECGELLGDGPRLQQALVNLLANSLRSTTAGQVLLRVAARPSDADGQVPVSITVQDSGPGMGAARLDHLLGKAVDPDPLARLRDTDAGLGLSLAQRLVQLMGGELDAQSHPGRGSSYEIRLKLARAAEAPLPARLPEQRLLLAKARTEGREAALTMLGHLGLAPGLAASTDAQGTLQLIASAAQSGQPFDWLLLDWLLPGPGPTGADLLAQVRRDHPGLRIAVLAPPGPEREPVQARAFGARAVCPEPLLPADVRRLLTDTGAAAAVDAGPALDATALAGLRVLLVEDHPINQEIALRMLGSRGALVEVANNGEAGLARLQSAGASAFDLVLMDLQMPVMDGLTATRRLRAMPGFEHLPVVAMTAHALSEEKSQCLAAGMQGHISKPLNIGRLVRELRRFLPAPPAAVERPLLDLQLGLRQFDGQSALYRRTLQGFADQYADGLTRWPGWLAEGAWVDLRRAAHTLQGLAATLGAHPLHVAALAMERSAVLTDAVAAAAQWPRVQQALAAAQVAIAEALARPWDAPPEAALETGPARLDDLRELLTQSDSRALDWWQAHGAQAGVSPGQRQAVEAALALLDFEAASAALGPPEASSS